MKELKEVATVFVKLGFLAFGGPSAHIAMLEDEVVVRRKWMSRDHFLDLVGATNLIPGPNSTQMTMHVGFERCGWPGLLVAGGLFILPASVITLVFAQLYAAYSEIPLVAPLFVGIKPAILAVILATIWRLRRSALKEWRHYVLGALVAAALVAGVNEIVVLLVGALSGMFWFRLAATGTSRLTPVRACGQ
jgi:chromate transporter